MNTTWTFDLAGLPAGAAVWPGRVSIPLSRGETGTDFHVRRPDGSLTPAQARPLVRWPDGSPRWVQLDFQATATGRHTVLTGPSPAALVRPLHVEREGGAVTAAVGRLRVTLDPTAGDPVRKIAWNGRPLAGPAFGAFRVTDHEGRVFAPAAVGPLTVEAEGPQRLQLSWEAEHRDATGRRSVDARFRVEFLAGVEGFRLTYQFFHRLPGHDYLSVRNLDAGFALEGLKNGRALVVQRAHSTLGLRRVARVAHAVPILIDATQARAHVDDVAVLGDTAAYPPFYSSHYSVDPVVGLEDEGVAMTAAMRFLEDQRPKTVDVMPGAVAVGLWPERAGVLRLPQGRSSQHRFAFVFTTPEGADALLAAPEAAYLEPVSGWLDAADSARAGATWDAPRLLTGREPGAGFFHFYLKRATDRFQVAGNMFDFGDSPHTPYSNGYAGLGMRPHGEKPARDYPFSAGLGGTASVWPLTSLFPVEALRPVWSNNEYDAIYGLALEALRTRSEAVLRKLTAVSRHQIEVDFVHHSDHWQQHRGTPCHTFDHTACSTAYPSHQWTQGLYYYYCITGDDDVPEVVRAICEYNLRWLAEPELRGQHVFNRELGWAVIAYVFGYELTGEARYRTAAADLIRELVDAGQGADFAEQLRKEAGHTGPGERLLGTSFAVNTILMGVCLYHKATGEAWARDLLERWVRIGFQRYNDRSTGPKVVDMFPECVAYLYELDGDPRRLEESLWALTLFLHGYSNPWGIPDSHSIAPLDAKLYGRVYRGLMHNLSACARAGLLPRLEGRILGE